MTDPPDREYAPTTIQRAASSLTDLADLAKRHPGVRIVISPDAATALAELLNTIATDMEDSVTVIVETSDGLKGEHGLTGALYDLSGPWVAALAAARAYLGEPA